jgi:hypothetical protein
VTAVAATDGRPTLIHYVDPESRWSSIHETKCGVWAWVRNLPGPGYLKEWADKAYPIQDPQALTEDAHKVTCLQCLAQGV